MSKKDTDGQYLDLNVDLGTENKGKSDKVAKINNESDLLSGYRSLITYNSNSSFNADERARSNLRQVKRLLLCMSGLDYKLAVFDEDLLIVPSKSHVNVYTIKKYRSYERRIVLTISIDDFYKDKQTNNEDLHGIFLQIYNLLNRNQEQQTVKLQDMLDNRKSVADKSMKILKKKEDYIRKYEKAITVYYQNINKERELDDKINKLSKRVNDSLSSSGDASRISEKAVLIDEKKQLIEARERITTDVLKIQSDLHNLSLVIDRVLFDNIAMMIRINNNFDMLDRL